MSGRVDELAALIVRYQKSYYDGAGEVSDAEFDLLWDELKRLDPEHPVLHRVGADTLGQKREHLIPMGSQDKAADPEAFLRWASRLELDEYLVQLKLDGASLELQYSSGEFSVAVTRGDGLVGDDVTANARMMTGFVQSLGTNFTGGIRGEVLLSRAVHKEKYSDKANPRNTANGLMKRKDGQGASDLAIICYDAVDVTNDSFFAREQDKLQWLAEHGFSVVEHAVLPTADAVIEHREAVGKARDAMEFDIDGLVVKSQTIDPDDARRSRPELQIAFKFEPEEAASTLRSVEWNPFGATYTPIAHIDPVRLAGTTVQRASLVNPRLIRQMGLKIGSRVAVSKRGEIIPKIERILENPSDAHDIDLPTRCERCGSELVDDETRLYCPNERCPKRAYARIRRWLDVLDIRDFGDVILTKLFESDRVAEIADLYTLELDELTAFERMGETLATKILNGLYTVRELPLAKFVAGFNIEGVGELIVEKAVTGGMNTLAKLRESTPEELAKINGIGEITGAVIVEGLAALRSSMDGVLATDYVRISAPVVGALNGKSFCFTGTLSTMTRSQAQDRVRAAGGRVSAGVTKDLSYLVTNEPDSGSSKNRKAAEYGVQIVTEEQFVAIVSADSSIESA